MEQVATLASVVAGAIIALAGTVLQHWLDRGDRKKRLLQQKLEHLLLLVFSLKTLTSEMDNQALGLSDAIDLDEPIGEIQVISNLYFPSLVSFVDRVLVASLEYKTVTLKFKKNRLNNNITMDYSDLIKEPYQKLIYEIESLLKKTQSLAKDFT